MRQALRAETLVDWDHPVFCDLFAHLCEAFPTRPDLYYALLEAPAPFDVSPNTVLGLRAYLQGQP